MDIGITMTRRSLESVRATLAVLLGTGVMFAFAALAGLIILVLLFQLGVAGAIDILFYRGVVLCAVTFGLSIALFAWLGRVTGRASFRDAIAAACLSLGLNLSVLVIAPVTVDRSISVFILGYMAVHPDRAFTTQEIETAFRDIYVARLHQIERRMDEQRQSGNVHESQGAYSISPRGLSFIAWARRIGQLFGADPRLVDQQETGRERQAGRP